MGKSQSLNSRMMDLGIQKYSMHMGWAVMLRVGHPLSHQAVLFPHSLKHLGISRKLPRGDVITWSKYGPLSIISSSYSNLSSHERNNWIEEEILQGHTDWVRDVAYAPSIGMSKTYLASASQVPLLSISLMSRIKL
jgi:hypothetical protein